MNCKHKQIIRITNNTNIEYYCTAKQKEITESNCRGCMLYNPEEISDIAKKYLEGLNNEM